MKRSSHIVLGIIPLLIAGGILWKSRHYDPAYFVPPQAATATATSWVPDKVETWILTDKAWFPSERMFEKIDGKDQFYQPFGVDGLLCGSWTSGAESWDMYLYVMKDSKGAHGAFSGEKPASANVEPGAARRYSSAGSVVIQAGRFYLQLISTSAEGATAATDIAKLANALSGHLLAKSPPETASTITLPASDQVAGSEKLIPKDAFGYTSLANVMDAQYVVNQATGIWFFADGGTGALARYTRELAQYGGEELFTLPDGASGGLMFDSWEIAGIINHELAGVRNAPTKESVLLHWELFKQRSKPAP